MLLIIAPGFIELLRPHSDEDIAVVVLVMLDELDLAPKLLMITSDNAGIMEPCVTRCMRSCRRSTMTRMGIFGCDR